METFCIGTFNKSTALELRKLLKQRQGRNLRIKLRGRGKRKGIPIPNAYCDLPLSHADKVAIYISTDSTLAKRRQQNPELEMLSTLHLQGRITIRISTKELMNYYMSGNAGDMVVEPNGLHVENNDIILEV